jgi:hypothetical protein
MKKIVLIIFVFCFYFMALWSEVITPGSSDEGPNSGRKLYFSAKVELQLGDLLFTDDDEKDTFDANPGFGFTAEILKKFSREFYLGAGAAMQLERDLDDEDSSEGESFKYFTAYGLLRADLLLNRNSRYLYSFVNLGFSTISGDLFLDDDELKGDLYFGLGLGIQVGPILLEAAYKNFGSYIDSETSDDLTIDVDYRVISISIGFIS